MMRTEYCKYWHIQTIKYIQLTEPASHCREGRVRYGNLSMNSVELLIFQGVKAWRPLHNSKLTVSVAALAKEVCPDRGEALV